jgi:DNA-binding transcriptional LysR family regulator
MPNAIPRKSRWERAIGRGMRLRDLHVFFTAVECGSLSQAARQLGVTTPSVSVLIADLEHAVGARLLDRSPRGVTPTPAGEALLARGRAAFDELEQGLRDIASLEDPGSGEVRLGCPESASAFVVLAIEQVARLHPRMRFVVIPTRPTTVDYPDLRNRGADLVFSRRVPDPKDRLGADFDTEVLFDDPFYAVVGTASPWAQRRNIDIAELANARWILPPVEAIAGTLLTDAFAARGLEPPKQSITTFSIHLRLHLASRGDYIAVLPWSVLQLTAARYKLKSLPIRLSARPSPLAVVTLRGRTLSAAADVFMQAARDAAACIDRL